MAGGGQGDPIVGQPFLDAVSGTGFQAVPGDAAVKAGSFRDALGDTVNSQIDGPVFERRLIIRLKPV